MKCRGRDDDDLADGAQQLDMEEIQEARVSEQGPTHRYGRESNQRVPFAGLIAIREKKRHLRIIDVNQGSADQARLPYWGATEVNVQTRGQVGREDRAIRGRVDAGIDRRKRQ